MSNDVTKEDIAAASAPRSDQLNADSLIAGPITVTVESVHRGNKEQPIIIELEGHPGTPWKPCKGMLRILIAGWTDNPREWIGKRLTLFRNPAVKYAGVAVGGIEISHMSDIPKQLEATKTIAKGIKSPFVVKRLDDQPAKPEPSALTEAETTYVADCKHEIASAESLEALAIIATLLADKSEVVRAAIRPLYKARKALLETENDNEH